MGSESRRIVQERQKDRFREYPGGSLQFVIDMAFDEPFSRLVEDSNVADEVPKKLKKRQTKKKTAK